jgi:DNA polymerase III delta prime subunit
MNTVGIIGHTRQLKFLELLRRNDTIPHTMLFSGKSGIGKKLVAQRFIASLFCSEVDSPCLRCPTCLQAMNMTFPDIIELHPDEKGTIPIGSTDRSEQGSVRWLIDRLSKKSITGTYGVIINGAEAISTGGQNALLKTIEEPQAGAHIIIITENKSLILPTILSRSMELAFNPLDAAEVKQALTAAGAGVADPDIISELSGGSVETALLLSAENTLSGIAAICHEITSYLLRCQSLRLDLAALQKKISMDQLLSILLNAYRSILSSSISGAPLHPFLADFSIADRKKLTKLIKILLALRKGLTNNLNIRSALKGMLYAIEEINDFGLPRLDAAE